MDEHENSGRGNHPSQQGGTKHDKESDQLFIDFVDHFRGVVLFQYVLYRCEDAKKNDAIIGEAGIRTYDEFVSLSRIFPQYGGAGGTSIESQTTASS